MALPPSGPHAHVERREHKRALAEFVLPTPACDAV